MSRIEIDASHLPASDDNQMEEMRWELARRMYLKQHPGQLADIPLLSAEFTGLYDQIRAAQTLLAEYDTYMSAVMLNSLGTLLTLGLVHLPVPATADVCGDCGDDDAEDELDAIAEAQLMLVAMVLRESVKAALTCALTDMALVPRNFQLAGDALAPMRRVCFTADRDA